MRARLALGVGLAIATPMTAPAQEHDGSYYCVEELSGGLVYNEGLKRWESTRFNPTDKFVVRFKYIGSHPASYDPRLSNDEYYVTVTESGSDHISSCQTNSSPEKDTVEFTGSAGIGACDALFEHYTFNLRNNRFLKIYELGYVDGIDKSGNTPSVSGGTCTKIQ